MTIIALAQELADEFGATIKASARDAVQLLALAGDESAAELGPVEIAIYTPRKEQPTFRQLVAWMPRLAWIHSTTAGVDGFASVALAERDVVITNSAGIYAPAMAEFAFAGMVSVARNLRSLHQAQDERRWSRTLAPGLELYGRRLGIVGYGATGRYLARVCKGFGMEVWGTRRTPVMAIDDPVDRLLPADELHTLLGASDFVVVTASLNATTRHLLGEAEFAAIKPGAGLVNIARGALIDQGALLSALDDGRLRGAVLDVVESEPLPPSDPLWAHPRVILTPHVSGDTPDGRQRSVDLLCRNLLLFLSGRAERMANRVEIADHL